MWDMMKIKEQTGIELTESLAMDPASSVCGQYFANPNAYYFGCDEICKDQVESYAKRKNIDKKEVEKWLSTILSYDPDEIPQWASMYVLFPPVRIVLYN